MFKKTGKLVFAAALCLYGFCLVNGITIFDYTATAEGGTLSIIGHTVDIYSPEAAAFWDLYFKAEREAARLVPSELRSAISRISELIQFSD